MSLEIIDYNRTNAAFFIDQIKNEKHDFFMKLLKEKQMEWCDFIAHEDKIGGYIFPLSNKFYINQILSERQNPDVHQYNKIFQNSYIDDKIYLKKIKEYVYIHILKEVFLTLNKQTKQIIISSLKKIFGHNPTIDDNGNFDISKYDPARKLSYVLFIDGYMASNVRERNNTYISDDFCNVLISSLENDKNKEISVTKTYKTFSGKADLSLGLDDIKGYTYSISFCLIYFLGYLLNNNIFSLFTEIRKKLIVKALSTKFSLEGNMSSIIKLQKLISLDEKIENENYEKNFPIEFFNDLIAPNPIEIHEKVISIFFDKYDIFYFFKENHFSTSLNNPSEFENLYNFFSNMTDKEITKKDFDICVNFFESKKKKTTHDEFYSMLKIILCKRSDKNKNFRWIQEENKEYLEEIETNRTLSTRGRNSGPIGWYRRTCKNFINYYYALFFKEACKKIIFA